MSWATHLLLHIFRESTIEKSWMQSFSIVFPQLALEFSTRNQQTHLSGPSNLVSAWICFVPSYGRKRAPKKIHLVHMLSSHLFDERTLRAVGRSLILQLFCWGWTSKKQRGNKKTEIDRESPLKKKTSLTHMSFYDMFEVFPNWPKIHVQGVQTMNWNLRV